MAPKETAKRLRKQLLQEASVLGKLTKGRKKTDRLPKTIFPQELLQGLAIWIL